MSWDVGINDVIKRTDLHDRFGGRRQGGISPSKQSENVIIFTSEEGELYGYSDGWQSDGYFHYTGEGQSGDQEMKQGNKALLNHQADRKSVRLFEGARGDVKYKGEFQVVGSYTTDAPDVDGEIRKVIVFKLRPIATNDAENCPVVGEQLNVSEKDEVDEVDVESSKTETFVTSSIADRTATRKEAELVKRYLAFRIKENLPKMSRLKIKPKGELQPLFTDLYSRPEQFIVEAKGTVTREAVRMAIGQLLDYRRFVPACKQMGVLLPECPRPDLKDLLHNLGIVIVYPQGTNEFVID